jgi:tRNA threonylcarbamoyladenosine modification (KEOPS) complex  Pcc1 subunit
LPDEADKVPDASSKVTCKLRLEFGTPEDAEKVHRSVALDSQGYLTSGVEGRAIVAEIHADSLNSLLHTLDDLLACTGVAERIVSKKA